MMNTSLHKIVLSCIAMMLLAGQANAQFITTFAKNVSPGQQNGLYYSLPQTVIQLDFVVTETVYEEGLLSNYADTYLEANAYGMNEGTSYALNEVRMTSKATPDPDAMFFVSFNMARGGGKPVFDILPNGIIRSVGMAGAKEEYAACQIEPNEPVAVVADQISVEMPEMMALMTSGKTNSQLAKEVADKIEEIRKAKFYLISGDVEMATNPETFKAMYDKLDELEQQYLSLFLGNRVARQTVHTVYVTPEKELSSQVVARFSESNGFTEGKTGSGIAITVETLPLNTTANISAPSQSAIEAMSYENKLMYRVPETANVKVSYGSRTLIEERQTVNQLGVILMAPLQGTMLDFDTTTGQIVGLRMQ